MITRRDLLKPSLVMVMEVIAMSTELLKDSLRVTMVKDLLSLVTVTPQELAITTEVPREFKAMVMEVTTRDLLRLILVMGMEVIAMSTEPLRDLLKVIMARDPLSLVTVTPQELAITTEVPREFRDMVMGVI